MRLPRRLLAPLLLIAALAGCGGLKLSFPGYYDERYPRCAPDSRNPDAHCYGGTP